MHSLRVSVPPGEEVCVGVGVPFEEILVSFGLHQEPSSQNTHRFSTGLSMTTSLACTGFVSNPG
jgi:hypothetical protein